MKQALLKILLFLTKAPVLGNYALKRSKFSSIYNKKSQVVFYLIMLI